MKAKKRNNRQISNLVAILLCIKKSLFLSWNTFFSVLRIRLYRNAMF